MDELPKDWKTSFSSGDRWPECTASPRELAKIGNPHTEKKFTVEGSAAHNIFEKVMNDWDRQMIENEFMGKVCTGDTGIEVEYEEEMIDHAFKSRDQLDSFMAHEFGESYSGKKWKTESWVPAFYRKGTKGKIDIYQVVDNSLIVTDYKYGKGVRVNPSESNQMFLYGVSKWHDLPFNFLINDVIVIVIQPRIKDGFRSHRFRINADDILQKKKYFMERIQEIKENPTFRPSKKVCQWCPLNPEKWEDSMDWEPCQYIVNQTVKMIPNAAAIGEAIVDGVNKTVGGLEDVSNVLLSSILNEQKKIELAFKLVEEEIRKRRLAGHDVPNTKLVRTTTHRKWKDANKARTVVLRHLKKAEAIDEKLKTPAKIDELLSKRRRRQQTLEEIAELSEKPEGRIMAVPADHKFKELVIGNQQHDHFFNEDEQ